MLMNSLPWLLQPLLLILLVQPIVCSTSGIVPINRHEQLPRMHSIVKREPLQGCGIFICDPFNKTGLVLFNATVNSPEPEVTVPKMPINLFKNPMRQVQSASLREIGDFRCLDDNDQARQNSYCNNVANYPTHSMLESMIKRQFTNFEKLLNQDLILPQEIAQRTNFDSEKLLCDTVQSTIFPKSGLTKNDEWMIIVNDEENYQQGVRAEECVQNTLGKPCKIVDMPSDYTLTCKQHYRLHKLWAVKDNITIAQEYFKIPCCCQCMWKSKKKF